MTPDPMVPRRRRSDASALWQAADWLRHYAIIWIPTLWLLTSLGYGIITPRLTAAQVQQNVVEGDARLQREIDSVKEQHAYLGQQLAQIQTGLSALVKLDCIDPAIPRQLKQIALPCTQ